MSRTVDPECPSPAMYMIFLGDIWDAVAPKVIELECRKPPQIEMDDLQR
jgi:hypothetical protein